MSKLLVIGSINMDMTIFSGRMPNAGETIAGTGFLLSPGGKGANQAVAAARMGCETAMCGCVGDDVFGRELVRSLGAHGVDTRPIAVLPDASTGVASITVADGDNRIILHAGANARVRADGQVERLIADCDQLMMQLEIPLETVMAAARMARRHGKRVFLNPAPAQPLPDEAYRLADYFAPNETEAGLLLSRRLETDQDMFGALDAFRARGVRHPLITLGGRGVACYLEGRPAILAAHRVDAVDTTAAGDTFIGALAAGLGAGRAFLDAARLAMRAAAICVTRAGAQRTIPTLDEVLAWRPDEQPAVAM